jgi:hypothetical protein
MAGFWGTDSFESLDFVLLESISMQLKQTNGETVDINIPKKRPE